MKLGRTSHQVKPTFDTPKDAFFIRTAISFAENMSNPKTNHLSLGNAILPFVVLM